MGEAFHEIEAEAEAALRSWPRAAVIRIRPR